MNPIDLAVAELQKGNDAEAEKVCRQILQHDDRDFDALHILGVICAKRDQFGEAERLMRSAIEIDPGMPVCIYNYGRVLCALERYRDAIGAFNRAAALAPNIAPIYSDRGNAESELGLLEDAVHSYDRALACDPRYLHAHYNRGNALQKLGRYEEALASYDGALALNPRYPEACCNRGITLRCLRRFDESVTSCERALAMNANFAEAHFAESDVRLLLGDFARGWHKYEWRWKASSLRDAEGHFAQPRWLGTEPLDGKTILLHSEQGLGDTIQFCRYVPLLAKRGAHIVLEVQSSLAELMRSLPGAADVIAKGGARPDFALHCPLASAPLALGTRLETIPAEVPYLSAPQAYRDKWRDKLGPPSGLRVAVNWAGNPNYRGDRVRSIGLKALSPLFGVPGVQFFGIQKDLSAGDEDLLQGHPNVAYPGADIESFSDTAAIISLMDLVVSSDTSVVHLAGALAAPTWTLLSFAADWRWLLDRPDSPWYPTMRLFRQPQAGNWAAVVAATAEALPSAARREPA